MLPVGPTGYGNSPYSAQSAFAGNPALIGSERLVDDGLPVGEAIAGTPRDEQLRERVRRVSCATAAAATATFEAFAGGARPGWTTSRSTARSSARTASVQWTRWPAPLRDRDPGALGAARAELADEIAFVALRAVALRARLARAARLRPRARRRPHRRHPDLRGARQRRRLAAPRALSPRPTRASRRWSPACRPTTSARPASAGATRSTAGTACARRAIAWWIERFRATLAALRRRPPRSLHRLRPLLGDPGAASRPRSTAAGGAGPGAHFFEALRRALRAAQLPLIAEDLGVVTPEVKALRDELRAARASRSCSSRSAPIRSAPDFLPHNYPRNAVVYTGTHDNDTTVGLVPRSGQRHAQRRRRRRRSGRPRSRYLGRARRRRRATSTGSMIRAVLMSVANVAIVPAQDLLGLGSEARMNRPGTDRGNWAFRLAPGALTARARASACATLCDDLRPREGGGVKRHLIAPAAAAGAARRATRSGTRTRSSTRCASARSTTATATASATSAGLAAKLDYLQDLGVTALWLLPFYPSPLRDDGYDIADYTDVHPDVRHARRLRAASSTRRTARGLRVITELVLNHTSDQHPWFQRARRAPAGLGRARLLRLERHARAVPRGAHHLQGLRAVELGLGSGRAAPTSGTASTPTSPISTSRTRRCTRRCSASSTSGSAWASTACASTPSPTSTSARGRTARTCPRRTPS